MFRWRLHYRNGEVYSNEDGPAEAAPDREVQVIIQGDELVGWRALRGADYYSYNAEHDEWLAHDVPGALDQMIDRGYLKSGFAIPTPVFREIFAEATRDETLPPKSAYAPGERPDQEAAQYEQPLG